MQPLRPLNNLLFLLTTLLSLTTPVTARTLPAANTSPLPFPLSPTTQPADLNHLTKRHSYTLICKAQNAQGKMVEDVAESRRCLGLPYQYRCDSEGKMTNQGLDDDICDGSCDCKKKDTDIKPRCIALGSGTDRFYTCF